MTSGRAMTTTLRCAHCGGDLGRGDGFCALCGVVVYRCPRCEASLPPGETSCLQCGLAIDPALLQIPFHPDNGESLRADMLERLRRATAGEFEIGRELGRGGMAAVFLAHELALDRKVAIKVMSPGLLLGDGMVDRFRHEAITIAHLHHPHIVSVYSVRQTEGLHFFVMQYVQGRSLEQVIRQAGRLPLPIVRSVLHQVGSALTYAHRRRVIHRDIKPGNILIDGDGNAVVSDFGIAKVAESPSQTMTGALIGTPAYMSPEQCRGAEVSGASDQYALGAVAYEMLTGSPPFAGSTYTILQAHVERPPLPLRERLAGCPVDVEATVLRMLAKDPAARWPSIADAMAALGAQPLADDDPLRLELTQLAVSERIPNPTSPARSRWSAPGRTPPVSTVGGVAILPPPPGLEVGDSFTLVALVRGPNGTRLPSGAVTWSTDAPDVLRLESNGGSAVAVGAGTARLTATCKGVSALLQVEVLPPRADEIVIDPPEHGVRAGDEMHLEATVRDKHGRIVERPVVWQTADPATATISGNGALIAQAPGLARISAVLDAVRSDIAIPILPARVTAIRLGTPPPALAGSTFDLPATPVDRWGAPLADRTVLWSSSDVRVAVVTAGGRVHALRPGTVVLTASCEGVSEALRVNVGVAPAQAPAASLPEPTQPAVHRKLRRRRPRRLLAGSAGAVVALGMVWLLSRTDPPAATAAHAEPIEQVGYTVVRDTASAAAVAITRRPARALRPAAAFHLAAEVRDAQGRPVPDAPVVWTSSDSTIARVDRASGWVRAVRPGIVQVVASSGTWRDSTPVTVRLPVVRPRPVASVAITPIGPLRVGDVATLQAAALDAHGAALDSAVTWQSDDASVAAVDPETGVARAQSPGTAVVVARSGGQSAWLRLSVLPTAVARVIVHGVPPLRVGQELTLSAIPTDAAGNALWDRLVSWTSSDPDVLEVDAATGLIAARSPGSVDVTATADGSSGSVRVTVFSRE